LRCCWPVAGSFAARRWLGRACSTFTVYPAWWPGIAANDRWLCVLRSEFCPWEQDSRQFLRLYDLSDPAHPALSAVRNVGRKWVIYDLAIDGGYVFTADDYGTHSYELKAGSIRPLNSLDFYAGWMNYGRDSSDYYASARQIALAGKRACFACWNVPGCVVADIASPGNLSQLFPLPDDAGSAAALSVAAHGDWFCHGALSSKALLTVYELRW
jgi:hypothetical protein